MTVGGWRLGVYPTPISPYSHIWVYLTSSKSMYSPIFEPPGFGLFGWPLCPLNPAEAGEGGLAVGCWRFCPPNPCEPLLEGLLSWPGCLFILLNCCRIWRVVRNRGIRNPPINRYIMYPSKKRTKIFMEDKFNTDAANTLLKRGGYLISIFGRNRINPLNLQPVSETTGRERNRSLLLFIWIRKPKLKAFGEWSGKSSTKNRLISW